MDTILIVDDEPDIREILSFNLGDIGYTCLTASNGSEAVDVLSAHAVDMLILDVMMPGISGFDLARSIRNDEVENTPYDLPIIFLTALGEEDDTLRGFAAGADDYIAKPFSIRLLVARVEALRKRMYVADKTECTSSPNPRPQISYEALLLDETTYGAKLHGTDIGLTKMEYELLRFLLTHQGCVFSRNDLLTQVWPDNGLVLERTVDVTITRLRKKIGTYKDQLKTKTGYGYYWEK